LLVGPPQTFYIFFLLVGPPHISLCFCLLVGPPRMVKRTARGPSTDLGVKRICFFLHTISLCFCLLVGPPLCPKQAARGPSPYVPYILVARPLSRAASWNGMTLASSPQASMQACLQPLAQRPRANVLPCTASDLARPKFFCSWALVGPPLWPSRLLVGPQIWVLVGPPVVLLVGPPRVGGLLVGPLTRRGGLLVGPACLYDWAARGPSTETWEGFPCEEGPLGRPPLALVPSPSLGEAVPAVAKGRCSWALPICAIHLAARPTSCASPWNGMTLASSSQASMQACLQPLPQRPRANVLPHTASDLARPNFFCSWALVGPPLWPSGLLVGPQIWVLVGPPVVLLVGPPGVGGLLVGPPTRRGGCSWGPPA